MRVLTDKVLFAGRPTPGIAFVVPITVEASYETRKIPLTAGRTYIHKGLEPVSTVITCTLYDDRDLADCREFIQYIRPSIDNSNTVTTWDVQHPSLGGLSEFVVKSITYPHAQKSGTYLFVIKIEEYREPEKEEPEKVGGGGGDGKIGPYEAVTETGEAHSGEADSLASAEHSEVDREIALARRQRDAARDRVLN
jgi:hypothetical protein